MKNFKYILSFIRHTPRLERYGYLSLIIAVAFSLQNCGQPVDFVAMEKNSSKSPKNGNPVETPLFAPSGFPAVTFSDAAGKLDPCTGCRQFPLEDNLATVVFEDRFPRAGDADFNDFVLNFNIQEVLNNKGQLSTILMDFIPRARGGEYDHQFLLVMDGKKDEPTNAKFLSKPMFEGKGDISLTYNYANGDTKKIEHINKEKDLIVFDDTAQLFDGKSSYSRHFVNVYPGSMLQKPLVTAQLKIKILNPELNDRSVDANIDLTRYRMMLHVKNKNKDIDLIEINKSMANMDSQGFPFGMIVPANWKYTLEGVRIDSAYPDFPAFRDWILNSAMNPKLEITTRAQEWYLHPSDEALRTAKVFDVDLFHPDATDTATLAQ